MEDLRPFGFKKCDKAKPSTIEIARYTMQELGKFHGLSLALKDQKPTEFEEFKQVKHYLLTALQSKNMSDLFGKGYDIATTTLTNENHKDITQHFKRNILRSFTDLFNGEISDRFGVLCHGICLFESLRSDKFSSIFISNRSFMEISCFQVIFGITTFYFDSMKR